MNINGILTMQASPGAKLVLLWLTLNGSCSQPRLSWYLNRSVFSIKRDLDELENLGAISVIRSPNGKAHTYAPRRQHGKAAE